MATKQPWEVWYASISFIEDDGRRKLRPVVILGEGEDRLCLVLSVTSKEKPEPYGYRLQKPAEAGLREGSHVLLYELRSIGEKDFQRRVGTLHHIDIHNIERLLSSR